MCSLGTTARTEAGLTEYDPIDHGLSLGDILGIVAAVAGALMLALMIGAFIMDKREKKRRRRDEEANNFPMSRTDSVYDGTDGKSALDTHGW